MLFAAVWSTKRGGDLWNKCVFQERACFVAVGGVGCCVIVTETRYGLLFWFPGFAWSTSALIVPALDTVPDVVQPSVLGSGLMQLRWQVITYFYPDRVSPTAGNVQQIN